MSEKKISSFAVFDAMCDANSPALRVAPISNIVNMKKVKAGCQITFGCESDVMDQIWGQKAFGGFIIADKEEFQKFKDEVERKAILPSPTKEGSAEVSFSPTKETPKP